jgi:hypothetical protein
MKQFSKILLIFLLCLLVCSLLGCSARKEYAGIYRCQEFNDTIILYEDGTGKYMGTPITNWKVSSGQLTITTKHPDHYYLDVYFEESMPDHELKGMHYYIMFAFGDDSAMLDDFEFDTFSNMIRVSINQPLTENSETKHIFDSVRAISGVIKAEPYTLEGSTGTHKLKVAGNCLVYEIGGGVTFIKQTG